jgi:hypothetical protein
MNGNIRTRLAKLEAKQPQDSEPVTWVIESVSPKGEPSTFIVVTADGQKHYTAEEYAALELSA